MDATPQSESVATPQINGRSLAAGEELSVVELLYQISDVEAEARAVGTGLAVGVDDHELQALVVDVGLAASVTLALNVGVAVAAA